MASRTDRDNFRSSRRASNVHRQQRSRGQFIALIGLTTAIAAILTSCAATKVRPMYESRDALLPKPQRILVYNFSINTADVTENQGFFHQTAEAFSDTTASDREVEIARQVSNTMAEELVAGIRELGLSAEHAMRRQEVPPNALAITGDFLNVDEGNRTRRLVIGFGSGGSKIETQVRVFAPQGGSFRRVLEFSTHADSGHMPGAAVTMGAGAAAQGGVTAGMAAANVGVGGVKAYRSATENMAARSAEQAVAYLSQFFGKQGWIPADKVRSADTTDR